MDKLNDLWDSFKIGEHGFSGRKLSAFQFMNLITLIHFSVIGFIIFGKDIEKVRIAFALAETLFYVDCVMLAVCLGLVTIPELIKFLAELKNGKDKTNTPQ